MDITLIDRTACPLCGHTQFTTHIPFAEIPVSNCDACGFIFSAKIMFPNDLEEYYARHFGGERHKKGQDVNARVNIEILEAIAPSLAASKANVLDVGTGYGYFLHGLRKRFYCDTVGVEISRQEAEFAMSALGLDVRNCDLQAANISPRSIDLATAFEVIEHIERPLEFCERLMNCLKPGGHAIIGTDNFGCDIARALGPNFPKWIPHTHICHFTAESLQRTLALAGFDIISIHSFTPWELVLRKIHRQIPSSRIDPASSYSVSNELSKEKEAPYRLYALRKTLSPLWARATLSRSGSGAMMYVLARAPS